MLLVPAVVNPETSYQEAWTRSQQQIRKVLPLAEKLKVIIAIEEVWNKFLLSPLEMARYIDEFKSPWVKSYLDVGNMVFYGYPQDWIRTLGKRVAKLHIKDFRFKNRMAEFVPLREGDIDWKASTRRCRYRVQRDGDAGAVLRRPRLSEGNEPPLRSDPDRGVARRNYKACRTSSACPAGFTFGKIFAIFPSLSMMKVVRAIPKYFLPYMLFSAHTPYASDTVWSTSASSG